MRPDPIQPVGINITRDDKLAFVALGPANHEAVIDATTHKVIKYLLVGERLWHMAFTPDEKYLLTTNGISNDVSVIDVPALKVVNTVQVAELPWGVAISIIERVAVQPAPPRRNFRVRLFKPPGPGADRTAPGTDLHRFAATPEAPANDDLPQTATPSHPACRPCPDWQRGNARQRSIRIQPCRGCRPCLCPLCGTRP